MSRSYRKTPIIKDNGKHKQFSKRQANKKVRHEICGSGAEYNITNNMTSVIFIIL